MRSILLDLRESRNIVSGVTQRAQPAAIWQRYRFVEVARPSPKFRAFSSEVLSRTCSGMGTGSR
jgi:hypothetical protein